MPQDIQIQLRDSKIIKADLNISDTAQIEAVTISGQKFYAKPQGLDLTQLIEFLKKHQDDITEIKIADLIPLIAGLLSGAGTSGILELIQIALPIILAFLKKEK